MKILKHLGMLLVGVALGLGAGMLIMMNGTPASAATLGHEHDGLREHRGVAATCYADGISDYWECQVCNKYFADENGVTEIAADALANWLVIPQLKHTTSANYKHDYVMPTCAVEGHNAYYACSNYGCGAIFSDKNCKYELTWDQVSLGKRAHKTPLVAVPEKLATCTTDGYVAHYACADCGATFTDEYAKKAVIDVVETKLGHQPVKVAAETATCLHSGKKEHYACTTCGELFLDAAGKTAVTLDEIIIAQESHSWDYTVPGYAATCTADGRHEYYHCGNGCDGKFKTMFMDPRKKYDSDEELVIKATGHKFDDKLVLKDNAVASRAYDEEGNLIYQNAVYYTGTCTDCGAHKGEIYLDGFAHLSGNTATSSNETVDDVIYDIWTVTIDKLNPQQDGAGYEIKITITRPDNFTEDTALDLDGVTNVQYKLRTLTLTVHFDELPTAGDELLWEFDWDGDGKCEQSVKLRIAA